MKPCNKCGSTAERRTVEPRPGGVHEVVTVVCADCGKQRRRWTRQTTAASNPQPTKWSRAYGGGSERSSKGGLYASLGILAIIVVATVGALVYGEEEELPSCVEREIEESGFTEETAARLCDTTSQVDHTAGNGGGGNGKPNREVGGDRPEPKAEPKPKPKPETSPYAGDRLLQNTYEVARDICAEYGLKQVASEFGSDSTPEAAAEAYARAASTGLHIDATRDGCLTGFAEGD